MIGHWNLEAVMQALYTAKVVGVPFTEACDTLRKTGGICELASSNNKALASPDCAFKVNSNPAYTVVVRDTYPSRPAPIDITTSFEYDLQNGSVMPKVGLMKMPKVMKRTPVMMGVVDEEIVNAEYCLQNKTVQLDLLIQTASRRGVSADELGQCLLQPEMGFKLMKRSGAWYNAVDLQGRFNYSKKPVYVQVHMTQHDQRGKVEIGLLARPA